MKTIHYLVTIFLLIGVSSCSKEGPEGPIGPQGEQGEQGVKGNDGTMLRYGKGEPGTSVGEEGDFYIDMDKSILYGPKASAGWGNGVDLIGAKGDKGDTGAKGQDGSQFLSGTAAPSTQGKVGDFYFHTSTATLYGPKTASGWGTGINLKGPKGDKGDKGDDGNANVRTYSFIIDKDNWESAHYGGSNVHAYFKIPVSLTGGIDIRDSRYVVLAYVRPQFPGGYSAIKQIPYVFGIDNNYGIKFELIPSRREILMSKTTNGWNNISLPLDQRPETVAVEIILIEINTMNTLQGKLDFKDINAVNRYFKLD